MNIIDSRVRLPADVRKSSSYSVPDLQSEQYDRVLGLTNKLEGSTLSGLYEALDTEGVDYAVMHAVSEGGKDVDALNDALCDVVQKSSGRFKGIACTDIFGANPGVAARQTTRAADAGLSGVSVQPAFSSKDIDDRSLYPVYARAEEEGLIVAVHTGVNYSRMHPIRHEKAEKLDQIACDFPDLKIMACHAGWPYVPEYVAVTMFWSSKNGH